jgi:hypothetical protein
MTNHIMTANEILFQHDYNEIDILHLCSPSTKLIPIFLYLRFSKLNIDISHDRRIALLRVNRWYDGRVLRVKKKSRVTFI